jgi:hypothetical protein
MLCTTDAPPTSGCDSIVTLTDNKAAVSEPDSIPDEYDPGTDVDLYVLP